MSLANFGDFVHLRLYIIEHSARCRRVRASLEALIPEHFPSARLEIVDILDSPDQASVDGVLLTPTLLRLQPAPTLRLIGDFDSDPDALGALLRTS